jgi:hypothetical protein
VTWVAPRRETADDRGRRQRLLLVTVVLTVGLGWYIWSGVSHVLTAGRVDYSKRPPTQVFANALGRPVPPGVTNLRVAGHTTILGLKHWVFITFDFTDAALKEVVDVDSRIPGANETDLVRSMTSGRGPNDAKDKRLVGWKDPNQIQPREVYMVSGGTPGTSFVWAGVMVVDRKQHRAYARLDGD